MDSKIIKPHQCSLKISHVVSIKPKYLFPTKTQLYLDKNRFLGLLDKKNCRNKIMKIFLFSNLALGNFPTSTCIEEIIGLTIFLNPQTKLDICFKNPFFLSHPKICQTALPSLVCKLNHERMYTLIMDLIPITGNTLFLKTFLIVMIIRLLRK